MGALLVKLETDVEPNLALSRKASLRRAANILGLHEVTY